MIDFTNSQIKNKLYSGANGSKLSIIYNNEQYMLKFPSPANKNENMSYANNCVSEYIGCKIYKSLNIPVQDVLLGTYTLNTGVTKTVVACKDFATNGLVLQDFASLKNQIIDSERNGYGTDLNDIVSTIDKQTIMDSSYLATRFWDMFITDAFIGNWDRHNGNWGFLYDSTLDSLTLAPVFDCGSSLFPQLNEIDMQSILDHKNEINDRIYNRPTSAITQNGKRINYYSFISSCDNLDCNAALQRFEQRIDMSAINTIIDTTPCITDIQKSFFKEMLKARKEKILDISYGKLHMREQSTPLKTAWINSIAVLDDAKSSSDQTIETNYFGS